MALKVTLVVYVRETKGHPEVELRKPGPMGPKTPREQVLPEAGPWPPGHLPLRVDNGTSWYGSFLCRALRKETGIHCRMSLVPWQLL